MKTLFRMLFSTIEARKALLAGGLMAVCSLAPACAQTVRMQMSVPFQFLLGNKVLPSGNYSVEIDKRAHTLVMSNATEYASIILAASSVFRGKNTAESGRLGFDLYETDHVLRRVWLNGEMRGYVIPLTKAGRELARKLSAQPSSVEVASR